MADKKISELTTASEIKNGDNLELSQDTGNGLVSLKATILAIANKMLKGINFTSDLQTTDKTVIGAINEVAQGGGGGGSSTLGGLNDVDIDDTTLADGQTLVFDGNEEKWVNGQGGGGTGGHTIIDENGNSMTARAGLQFVGGANVSDDATNNKTIVDLASVGGIDGVFIDTSNLVKNDFTLDGTAYSWVATEDCILTGILIANASNSAAYISIDNDIFLFVTYQSSMGEGVYLPVKKGQTIEYRGKAGSTMEAYGIQTGTTHSKFQPVIYSTEEREIGVWTDGKPLYQKTIDFGAIPNSTSKSVAHNISNLDKIVSFDSVMISSDSFETVPSGENSNFRLTATDTNVNVVTSANWNDWSSSFITLRYTKSTDTAGSGTWTPQGVPAVHYSTDEQVIGTWVDGRTIFAKTFTGLSVNLNSNDWITINDAVLPVGAEIIKHQAYRGDYLIPFTIYAAMVDSSTGKIRVTRTPSITETLGKLYVEYVKASS